MSQPTLHLEAEPSSEDLEQIRSGLTEHAAAFVERPGFRPLALMARDEQGKLVGGAYGYVNWTWLDISLIWVEEEQRGTGLGASLLLGLEEAGRERGCLHSHLDTFSYQARPFYEAHGYEVFAQLEDYPPGHQRFFLRKTLSPANQRTAEGPRGYLVRPLREGEEDVVCQLILDTFHEFEAEGYSEEGLTNFRAYADPAAMSARTEGGDHFALVVEGPLDGTPEIAGVIEIRNHSHVSQLFVAGSHHRRGLARTLLEHALARCRIANPDLVTVTVASSTYAVEVYERLGFVRTGPERVERGIRVNPMELSLAGRGSQP